MFESREAAHYLARVGISVFPVSSRTKTPAIPAGENWQNASTIYAERIDRWWWPKVVPAIDLQRCNLIVIDADRHGGPDGVELFDKASHSFGGLPSDVPIVRSPRNGLHFYFTQPEGREPLGCSRGGLASLGGAIDVKGRGGYIVAPGAVLENGGRYEPVEGTPELAEAFCNASIPEIPAWLVDLIEAPRRAHEARMTYAPPVAARDGDLDAQWAAAALNAECAKVAASGEGQRNSTLFSSALAIGELIGAGYFTRQSVEASLLNAALAAGVSPREAARTIKSGIERGQSQPRMRPERKSTVPTARRYPFSLPKRATA